MRAAWDGIGLRDGDRQLFLDWKLVLVITAIREWEEMTWTMSRGAGKQIKQTKQKQRKGCVRKLTLHRDAGF